MQRVLWSVVAVLLVGLSLATNGCGLAAVAARAVPQSVDAQYKGLAGQKVAVMVWTERAVRIDYPSLRTDAGTVIQENLIAKTDEDALKKAEFPWECRSVQRFLKEHPEFEGHSVTEFAHRLSGITRLIYVEVTDFSTRSETAVQLYKGAISGNVMVLEVEPGKSSKIVYQKNGVRATFPPRAPEGVLDATEAAIYGGTIKGFSLNVAELFYAHVIED